ncbi:rRNA maturation RNase YbeY [Aquimarina spongiae]|uniref:Endoribonuclease YbeY n=1 Tax=Aquimarina spongiae TaxID=570521 RepID=A0A1M6FC30_9FLAO|nr:rRNA maturation RNase YbeY [Aquimarina spongiae]SHI95288.1 rRNA maturation RNase YbeY [Aquimarina spongiae]
MINFYYETVVGHLNEPKLMGWLNAVASSEDTSIGEISYIFCDDEYLLEINKKFLNHHTYTDIISFDDTIGNLLNGDIFISHERVVDNAKNYDVSVEEELRRVMVHGLLHLCGFKDKTDKEASLMRQKEDEKLRMFHVEHPKL